MKPLFAWLSRSGQDARLSILIFHRVVRAPDPLLPDELQAARFDAICTWLSRWFNVLPLTQALARIREGDLPPRSLCITFDDGYADSHDVAVPILQRHGLNATFFITTGVIGGGMMWNDVVIESLRSTTVERLDLGHLGLDGVQSLGLRSMQDRRDAVYRLLHALRHLEVGRRTEAVQDIARRAAARMPEGLMMDMAQLRALAAAGMGIGAHTVNHPILARMSPVDARAEMRRGKADLEGWLDREVNIFAYPNGKPGDDFGPEHAVMAHELGFKAALTTAWGVATRATDPYLVPRFTPWGPGRIRFAAQLARNLSEGKDRVVFP